MDAGLVDAVAAAPVSVPEHPEPDPRPAPSVTVPVLSGADWAGLLARYPGWDVGTMLRIIDCESGGNPGAVSPPDSDGVPNYGGLQLHGDPGGLNPEYAVAEAYRKWSNGGYGHWAWCYANG